MARSRNDGAAEAAAAAASEAARVMQARQQEVRQQQERPSEPELEAKPEPEAKPKKEAPREVKHVEANPDRESKMEEIRKARGEKPDEPVETAPKEKPAPAEVQAPEAPPEVPPAPTVKTVKVKVDGVESEVPEADVDEYGGIRPYQVAKALENRLRKEAEERAQDRKLFAQLLESVQKQHQPPAEPAVSDDEFLRTKMDVIRFGTPEEGAAAMREALARISKPVDQNAIVLQATEKWRHDQAIEEFGREYGDVLANPTLAVLARALQTNGIEQLRKQPPQGPIDWKKFYATIGNEIRGVAGRPSQSVTTPNAAQTSAANQPGTPSQVSEKEARKEASIVNLPTAAARAALPEEPKPETREEAFARMKASRIS